MTSQLQEIQDLYDRHLYLQAYRRSARYWTPVTDLANLSVDELILGGRLAGRLGGLRLSRWLFETAFRRQPSNPRARYFSMFTARRNRHLSDDLQAFEQKPELEGADPELQAWWLERYASIWARLRDFERAFACLNRARSYIQPDAWLLSAEAEVLGLADRWPDALAIAERACQMSPGARPSLQVLCDSLLHLGRIEEAAQRAAAAAAGTESLEVAGIASWHLCVWAETLEGGPRLDVLQRAGELVDRFPELAPLADREARSYLARARLDIADLAGDHQQMARWAVEVRSPYHRRVAENLRNCPQGRRILLPHRRIQQKYSACVPTSISAALDASGVSLDADEMAAEMTYGGTVSWAAAEWLEQRGLLVRFFVVNPAVAARLIQHRIPFVMMLKSDDMGHAVAAIGIDEAAGTLLVHDPAQPRMAEYLLHEIRHNGGPLDPEGMAIVQPEQAAQLDSLLQDADPQVADAYQCYIKADQGENPAARRNIVEGLATRYPGHPGTRFLQSLLAMAEGQPGEALAGFQQLLNEFPYSALLRRYLLDACRSFGNLALTRKTLEDVVERGVLPGIQSGQDWSYPPPTYICQYADLLRLSAATRPQARRLLHSVIDRYGAVAEAWHILGDLRWYEHDRSGALLCYRLASGISSHDERSAHAYSTALHAAGREAEGLAWLEQRVQDFGQSPWGAGPWITWINTLENFGYPERALTACRQALQQHGGTPELLAFATSFFARIGHWEEAEASLSQLEAEGHAAAYTEAATQYHRMRGQLSQAIQYCEQWVGNSPYGMDARGQLLDLVAQRDGAMGAIEMARGWLAARGKHDRLEELYYWQLERRGRGWRGDLLLARRVKRNPEDAWAWQRMAFSHLLAYDSGDELRGARLQPRVEAVLAQCDRTAPEALSTLQARALWAEFRARWQEAVAAWLEIIRENPLNYYSYRRTLGCCAALEPEARRRVLEQLTPILRDCSGHLWFARDLLLLIDERFGRTAARAAAGQWRQARPEDPEVIEAAANLLLTEETRTAAEHAIILLQPAIERFPYNLGLRFSLANAQRKIGQDAEAAATLREILRRHPGNTDAYIHLAAAQLSLADDGESVRLLDTAAANDPRNPAIWRARVQRLLALGRMEEARQLLRDAVQFLQDDRGTRQNAVDILFQSQDEQAAVEVAREGVKLAPRDGFHWWLLATALQRAPNFAGAGEVEACLRRAVSADGSQFQPADLLSVELCLAGRHDEAEQVLRRMAARMPDASPAHGRLAWIRFQLGQKDQAMEALAATVSQAPWYYWGWAVLIEWLTKEKKWELARRILMPLAPEMPWDAQLRAQRVYLLSQTDLPADQLEAEIDGQLHNFPEYVPAHLGSYDWLRAHQRPEKASAVVRAARDVEPDNVFLLARLVEVFCLEQKKQEALEALQRVWFTHEESPWPAEYAWSAIGRAHYQTGGYRDARWALARGSQPAIAALGCMAAHALDFEALNKKARQPLWRTWLPGRGAREALALLAMVDHAPWANNHCRAALLQRLSEFGYQRLVLRYGRQNPAIVDADAVVWTEMAGALVSLGRKERARKMLAAWPTRKGVTMTAVVYYVLCIPKNGAGNLREILSACKLALASLRHDQYAKYLAHVQADACILLRDRDAFLQTWAEQQAYFTGRLDPGEWFLKQQQRLLQSIPELARRLEQDPAATMEEAVKELQNS